MENDDFTKYRSRVLVLRPLGELPPAILDQDMMEALAEPEIIGCADWLLTVVGDWMETNHSHEFRIQATARESWGYGLDSGLRFVLEKLPHLCEWCLSDEWSFKIDIELQGQHLRMEWSRDDQGISHGCTEDHWQSAIRVDGDWIDTPESILSNCRDIAQEMSRVARHLKVADYPVLKEWFRQCGLREGADREPRRQADR